MRILKWILAAPFILAFALFALANRQVVSVGLDPFNGGDIPNSAIVAPLFIILILAMMVGVVLGGVVTWFGQGKYRKAARQNRAEADRWRQQAQTAQAQAANPPPVSLPRAS